MNARHCCDRMSEQVDFRCDQHPDPGMCGDYLVGYSERFDEYGLWVHDGPAGSASSWIEIRHCPCCGVALPDSRRDEWFDRLEALGVEPDEAPDAMQSHGWWSRPARSERLK